MTQPEALSDNDHGHSPAPTSSVRSSGRMNSSIIGTLSVLVLFRVEWDLQDSGQISLAESNTFWFSTTYYVCRELHKRRSG